MKLHKLGLTIVVPFLACSSLWAGEFGMLTDVQGAPRIERSGQYIGVDLGDTLQSGDRLLLAAGESATVVSYGDCEELALQGAVSATVDNDSLKASPSTGLVKARTLPTCYRPDELNVTDSGSIGGLVLRSPRRDPMAQLRAEFNAGTASHTTLVILVMHDLFNGSAERARPYFDKLRAESPSSPFVIRYAHLFDQPSSN